MERKAHDHFFLMKTRLSKEKKDGPALTYTSELLFYTYHLYLTNRLTSPSSHSRLFYNDVVTESRILDEVVFLHEIHENSD